MNKHQYEKVWELNEQAKIFKKSARVKWTKHQYEKVWDLNEQATIWEGARVNLWLEY